MSLDTRQATVEWVGKPFGPLVPQTLFTPLAIVLMLVGFFFAALFKISEKSFGREMGLAMASSTFLGFGVLFGFLAVGIYL